MVSDFNYPKLISRYLVEFQLHNPCENNFRLEIVCLKLLDVRQKLNPHVSSSCYTADEFCLGIVIVILKLCYGFTDFDSPIFKPFGLPPFYKLLEILQEKEVELSNCKMLSSKCKMLVRRENKSFRLDPEYSNLLRIFEEHLSNQTCLSNSMESISIENPIDYTDLISPHCRYAMYDHSDSVGDFDTVYTTILGHFSTILHLDPHKLHNCCEEIVRIASHNIKSKV